MPDPEHYGVAELDGDRVVALVEKPPEPPSNLALVGVYLFTALDLRRVARSIALVAQRARDHRRDPALIDAGQRVEPHIVRGWWKDTGRLEDMLEANRLVLEDIEPRIEGELIDSQVDGRVVIEPGARLERSAVRGPAIIGARTSIIDSYVGPYTAIEPGRDHRARRGRALDRLAGSSIMDLDGRMEASLLGRNVQYPAATGSNRRLPLPGRRQLRDRDPKSRP